MMSAHHHRSGYALVELVLSMTVTAVLMGGLASTIVIASRAIPDRQSPLGAAREGTGVVEQLASELLCAQLVTEQTPTAITFAVADRDGDALSETIRYVWSGTPGDPLTRSYNGLTAADVAQEVYQFDLTYDIRSGSGTAIITAVGIVLQAGAEPSTAVHTSVRLLNQPTATLP